MRQGKYGIICSDTDTHANQTKERNQKPEERITRTEQQLVPSKCLWCLRLVVFMPQKLFA